MECSSCGARFSVQVLREMLRKQLQGTDSCKSTLTVKSLSLTHELQEATTQEINMEDDDPRALQVLLQHLYMMQPMRGHWLCKDSKYVPGTLKTLVQVAVLADKYELPLLGELVLSDCKRPCLSCCDCLSAVHRPCIDQRCRVGELLLAYETAFYLPETAEFDALKRCILCLCIAASMSFSQWWSLPKSTEGGSDEGMKHNMEVAEEVIARSPDIAINLLGVFARAAGEMSKQTFASRESPDGPASTRAQASSIQRSVRW